MKSIGVVSVLVTFLICSSVEANPLKRIVNGDQAVNYQFPWHVSIHSTKTTSAKSYCGGSIIAPNFVLTAASCVKNSTQLQVDIGSILFVQPFQTQITTQYQIHPQYNDQTKINNIAVIRLGTSLIFSTNIRSIILPRLSEQSQTFEKADSYVSGFGVSQAGGNYLTNELRFARKTVISNDKCRQSFAPQYIDSSVMCALGHNGNNQTICFGDQGGALVSHNNGAWVQIGVASLIHPTGCTGTTPAAYTRVAPYLQWIQQLTGIVPRP